jgi:hypothetical protein
VFYRRLCSYVLLPSVRRSTHPPVSDVDSQLHAIASVPGLKLLLQVRSTVVPPRPEQIRSLLRHPARSLVSGAFANNVIRRNAAGHRDASSSSSNNSAAAAAAAVRSGRDDWHTKCSVESSTSIDLHVV